MGNPNTAPLLRVSGPLPFAAPQGKPLPTSPVPHLGGYLIPIAGPINASTNTTVKHPLRAIPRSVSVFDSGTAAQPILTIVSRSATQFVVSLGTAIPAGQTLILFVQ